nr:MAG TPA: restriction endonuclease [Caudoviricetes sp.]
MDTKKCNKCGKVKPLPEMTRRRDEETGEFKYLAYCKSCKAEYQKSTRLKNTALSQFLSRQSQAYGI